MNAKVAAVQELRRSNAAGAIPARKVRRQGTRANARRAAVREWS
jgi:hypothetical protein